MKNKSFKRPIGALVLGTFLALSSVAVLAACDDPGVVTPEVTLTGIELDTSKVKMTFDFGEAFTSAGLVVNGSYSDGEKKAIPLNECTVSSPSMATPGQRSVSVAHKGFTARYTITILDKVMPEIGSLPLVDIPTLNEDVAYRVEAESFDMVTPDVKLATGATSFVVDDSEGSSITSGGEYLSNFGVVNNYVGFTYTAGDDFEDCSIVLRLSHNGEETLNLGEALRIYNNYDGYGNENEVALFGKTVLPNTTEGELNWQDIILFGIDISVGTNTFTFSVLSEDIINIDCVDFYVGKRYINSVVELPTEGVPVIKDFEDFDLEKIVNRPDMIEVHKLKPGECYLESPRTAYDIANTSKGTSAGGFMEPTEISTTIRIPENTGVSISMKAAKTSDYVINDLWEFYIDGVKLDRVESKNIRSGSAGSMQYWNWQDTSLGVYDLEAGDHFFKAILLGEGPNVDTFTFESGATYTPPPPPPVPATEFNIDKVGVITVEAETADFSNLIIQEGFSDIRIETPSNASGGQSIGAIGGGYISIPVTLNDDATLKFTAVVSKFEGGLATDRFNLTLDDTTLNIVGKTIKSGVSGGSLEDQWFNWTDITADTIDLPAGSYDFRFNATSAACNIDCFRVETVTYGEFVPPIPPIEGFDITSAGAYTFEAETADFSNLIPQTGFTEIKVENAGSASGGKSIGGVGGGYIDIPVRLGSDATVLFTTVAAKFEGALATDKFNMFLDSTPLDIDGLRIKPGTPQEQWYNWDDITAAPINLPAGDYTFRFATVEDLPNGTCNIDCFKAEAITYGSYYVAPTPDIVVDSVNAYKVEAEDADHSLVTPQEGSPSFLIETPSNASNGRSLGRMGTDSVINVVFKLEDKATIRLAAAVAKYEGEAVSNYCDFEVNGVPLPPCAVEIPHGYGSTNETLYFNWIEATVGQLNLDAGIHVFTFKGAINLDYLLVEALTYGEFIPTLTPDITFTEIGTVTFEAESADLTNVIPQSGFSSPLIEHPTNASGGASVGAMGGGYISINITSAVDCTVKISSLISKYEGGDADQYIAYSFDGVEGSVAGQTVNPGNPTGSDAEKYFNWTSIDCGTVNLTAGVVYQFRLLRPVCNLDCFTFEVLSYGSHL